MQLQHEYRTIFEVPAHQWMEVGVNCIGFVIIPCTGLRRLANVAKIEEKGCPCQAGAFTSDEADAVRKQQQYLAPQGLYVPLESQAV